MLFNDGIATVFAPVQNGKPGEKPKQEYTNQVFISYYGQKTVGVQRYWNASAHDDKADLLIEIQRFSGASTEQRVQLTPHVDTGLAGYYKILQFQHVANNDGLPATDLTLERIDAIDEP